MSSNIEINYIIREPLELLDKLILEAERINSIPDKNDFFNFVVTASVMSEWIYKHYENFITDDLKQTLKGRSDSGLPIESESWIVDKTCLPNQSHVVRHILNSIRICWNTTNATKHYKWRASDGINSISTDAKINNVYDYLFTSVEKGLFIRYRDENYSIEQVKNILVQFYPKFISYLEQIKKSQ